MKARLITLLLALAAAGCSTVLAPNAPITAQSGKPVPAKRIYQRELTVPSSGRTAKVSFLRDAGFLGGGCTHKILVDGHIVFAIRGGEYQTLHLAPGRYLVGLEIERGICPEFSSSRSLVLRDGAEDTYRILIPPLYNPLMGSIPVPGSPRVLRIDATPGGPIEEFAYANPIAKPSGSPGTIVATPSLSAQRPQPIGTGWRIKFYESGSNPVVADGVLYVGSADGAVVCSLLVSASALP